MAGYSVLLKDGKCIISNLKGIVDGQIPLTGGLYNHIYTPGASESANVAHTTLTLHELHWDMGHISPHVIKELVKQEVVTRLTLDLKSKESFCNTCTKAKPTQKPILKECTSPFASNLGNKLHSDVWGPAMPCSYDGKDYFVSFIHNHSWWS